MRKITPILPSTILISILLASFVSTCFAEISAETKKMAVEYRSQGLKAQRNGDPDTALVYFQKAMELDPTLAVAYNDAGVIYEAKGWNDRAKEAYGKAIDLDPTLASPYYNLGSVHEKEGDFEKAIYYFKKRVLVGDWNDEWTMKARRELQSMGVSDPELRQDFLDSHLASLESAGEIKGEPRGNDLDPKRRKRDSRLHAFRGKQLYYMGMYPEALVELGVAVTLDPKNKEAKKMLEETHRKSLINN